MSRYKLNDNGKFSYEIKDKHETVVAVVKGILENIVLSDNVPDQVYAKIILAANDLSEILEEARLDNALQKLLADGKVELSFNENGEEIYRAVTD